MVVTEIMHILDLTPYLSNYRQNRINMKKTKPNCVKLHTF